MKILEAREIVKQYPLERELPFERRRFFTALNGVNLSLESGATIGVVGESGSGKSTLGEILGDLQRPTTGSVLYRGRDIRTLDRAGYREFRRGVQFIFQNPRESMNPHYTIGRVLLEPMEILLGDFDRVKATNQVCQMLERVGLEPDSIHKYAAELSGGQCQRMAIARALLLSPEVIVCDECVSALDVSIQAQILNLLRDLQREFHTAYLFISHDMGVIHYMSDYILVLHSGQLVEEGSGAEVMGSPKADYTKLLISSAFAGGEEQL